MQHYNQVLASYHALADDPTTKLLSSVEFIQAKEMLVPEPDRRQGEEKNRSCSERKNLMRDRKTIRRNASHSSDHPSKCHSHENDISMG